MKALIFCVVFCLLRIFAGCPVVRSGNAADACRRAVQNQVSQDLDVRGTEGLSKAGLPDLIDFGSILIFVDTTKKVQKLISGCSAAR